MKCLSLFIRSQKENLKERIRDLLPTLFSTGISEELTLVIILPLMFILCLYRNLIN